MLDLNEVKLSEIADVRVGFQARNRIEEDVNGKFSLIRPQDFTVKGELIGNPGLRFSPAIDPARYLIEDGDILVIARGHHHAAHLIEVPLENAVTANTFYIVRVKDQRNIIPAYLLWWINQTRVQAYFHQQQGKSTIPFISKSILLDCVVQIPALETQEKIANMINLWKREQRLTTQLIEKKNALVQTICQIAASSNQE